MAAARELQAYEKELWDSLRPDQRAYAQTCLREWHNTTVMVLTDRIMAAKRALRERP